MQQDGVDFQPGSSVNKSSLLCLVKSWALTLWREVNEGDLKYRAMALVYTTLLSLVPLLAVSFSVLKAFGVHNQIKPFLLEMLKPLGEKGEELGTNIVGFVQNIEVGVLGSLGIVMLIYSVISLLEIIKNTFNHVWRCSETRTWLRRVSDYLSILLIGPVLVFTALGFMASMENLDWVQRLILKEPLGSLYYFIGILLPYLLIISAFTFVYLFMPSCRVEFRSALIGGIVGGLGWKTVGWAFGAFVVESSSYNAIYSSFAIMILFMFWLYVSWLVMLLGGAVAFYHQNPEYLNYHGRNPELSHRQHEMLGLLVITMIGRAYYEGRPPWSCASLAAMLSLPNDSVRNLLQNLEEDGLLTSLHTDSDSYVPSRALETLALKNIYQAIRQHGSNENLHLRELGKRYRVFDLSCQIEQTTASILNGLTLRDLVIGNIVLEQRNEKIQKEDSRGISLKPSKNL